MPVDFVDMKFGRFGDFFTVSRMGDELLVCVNADHFDDGVY
jgi:hypothetical protein